MSCTILPQVVENIRGEWVSRCFTLAGFGRRESRQVAKCLRHPGDADFGITYHSKYCCLCVRSVAAPQLCKSRCASWADSRCIQSVARVEYGVWCALTLNTHFFIQSRIKAVEYHEPRRFHPEPYLAHTFQSNLAFSLTLYIHHLLAFFTACTAGVGSRGRGNHPRPLHFYGGPTREP